LTDLYLEIRKSTSGWESWPEWDHALVHRQPEQLEVFLNSFWQKLIPPQARQLNSLISDSKQ
jgi:hypothetical protein